MSRGRGPRGGQPPPEGASVGYPPDSPGAPAPAQDQTAEHAPPTPDSTESERAAASQRAEQILDRALSVREWSAQDRTAIREQMGRADSETRREIIRSLSAAINAGEVQVKLQGPTL